MAHVTHLLAGGGLRRAARPRRPPQGPQSFSLWSLGLINRLPTWVRSTVRRSFKSDPGGWSRTAAEQWRVVLVGDQQVGGLRLHDGVAPRGRGLVGLGPRRGRLVENEAKAQPQPEGHD